LLIAREELTIMQTPLSSTPPSISCFHQDSRQQPTDIAVCIPAAAAGEVANQALSCRIKTSRAPPENPKHPATSQTLSISV
jgi:hypothetical protein